VLAAAGVPGDMRFIAGDLGGGGAHDLAGADGASCTGVVTAQQVPPTVEIMIVQQLGANMAGGITAMDMSTLFNVDVSGLEKVLAPLGNVSFGLMHFPDLRNADLGCPAADGVVDIAPAPANAAHISATLASFVPNGMSFGSPAVLQASSYLVSRPASARFLIVVTDGIIIGCDSTCNCGDDTTTFTSYISDAAHSGTPVFVLGAAGDTTEAQYMTNFANAGLMANTTPGEPAYYVPSDPGALSGAITAAVARAVSCSYTLPSLPSDPSAVSVASDGTTFKRDTTHSDGWDFGADDQTIVVYGSSCTLLRARANTHVDVTVGGC
jgi:hypothetical protein